MPLRSFTIMRFAFTTLFLLLCTQSFAQRLKPGFDKAEYIDLLKMNARILDTGDAAQIAVPKRFRRVYRSAVVGLDNRWSLAVDESGIAVIAIRGTVASNISWLANFYSAMTPANGWLVRAAGDTFRYRLADNPKAAVHIGWLTSLAYLMPDIERKIDSLYGAGARDMIVTGHSQGGAIAYLLTAYLRQRQQEGTIPKDIQFKTYCSAAPKPGNLFFAYAYETLTTGGWAYNVVNTADWVPQSPVGVQTVADFNPTNPFSNARTTIRKQKFPRNLVLRYAYNQLDKPTRKALRRNRKYLGRYAGKAVKKHLAGYAAPPFYNSGNYERTGNIIVLQADSAYYQLFPESETNPFAHHLLKPYLYLAEGL